MVKCRSPRLISGKAVCVRVDESSYTIFKEMADLNRWSVAATIRYCAEQYLNIGPQQVVLPEGHKRK